jgi:hypothetical protein
MIRHHKPALLGIVALSLFPSLFAQNNAKPQKLTEEDRQLIIRTFQAELPFARRLFPTGKIGLKIDPTTGAITPSEAEVRQISADFGPAAKPGDRVKITNVYFKGSSVIFEINGGPVKRKKWYERIQVSGSGGGTNPGDRNPDVDNTNARGSYVMLSFKGFIPEMPMQKYRELLAPVLDFNSTSGAEAYAKALPPIVQAAIKEHRALVGMDRDMVVASMGRPPKKYRDRDGDTDYEEWIYGEPPQEVAFVRFVGDRVVRIETMKVDGQKQIRTAKEVDLDQGTDAQKVAKSEDDQPAQKAPSLLKPGEKTVSATPGAQIDPKTLPNPDKGTSNDPATTMPGGGPPTPGAPGGPPTLPPSGFPPN